MTDSAKTERIQLMMSPDDVALIDEWAHRRRIKSRSEAIRQMTAIAAGRDGEITDIDRAVLGVVDALAETKYLPATKVHLLILLHDMVGSVINSTLKDVLEKHEGEIPIWRFWRRPKWSMEP